MADDTASIYARMRRHPRGWLTLPLMVGPLWVIDFVVHTGHTRSSISRRTYTVLVSLNLLKPPDNGFSTIENLSARGQALPNLNVRVGPAATTLGTEGILGLDFLEQFQEVRVSFRSLQLTLS